MLPMKAKTQIQVTAYVVAGAYSLAIFLAGLQLPHTYARVLSGLPLLLVLCFGLFDKLLWRIWPIKYLIRSRPVLLGTWKGSLSACHLEAGGTHKQQDPIDVFVVIRQRYTEVSVMLVTAESRSRSTLASIIVNDTDDFTLHYQYQNRPSADFRSRSPIHFGGAVIDVSGRRPRHVKGEYWTDRQTWGTFEAMWITNKVVSDFDEAQLL